MEWSMAVYQELNFLQVGDENADCAQVPDM
jgi:hypothetical protein